MSKAELLEKYKSLPVHLQLVVDNVIESLITNPSTSYEEFVESVRWAEEPDNSALYGLGKENPLNLEEIRSNNWKK